MCEPTTIMMAIGLGMNVAGTVVGGLGKRAEAHQQAEFQDANKSLSEQRAGDALLRGNRDAGTQRMKGSQIIGAQKVGFAAGGVDVSTGSAAQTMADTRMMSELDAQTIENNAAREAWGHKVQAWESGQQANALRAQGDQGLIGTFLTAGAEAAKGIGSLIKK